MPLAVRWYLWLDGSWGGAVAYPPDDALGQLVGQGSVDCGVRLAEDARQLRRIDEGRPAEGVEQLSFGDRHVLRVAKESLGEHPLSVSIGHRSPFPWLERVTEDLTNLCPLTISPLLIIMMHDTSGRR